MKVLFINACMRENSRTLALCRKYIEKHLSGDEVSIKELVLSKENLTPLYPAELEERLSDIGKRNFDSQKYAYAKDFADADLILIASPYWDYTFPALFKIYMERVCVNGITFGYGNDGLLHKYCKAEKMVYITTSGGYIGKDSTLEHYVNNLCTMFCIPNLEFHTAEGLDIYGNDVEAILRKAEENI